MQILKLAECFQWWTQGFTEKKSCLFRVSKNICSVTTRIDEQMTNCIILRLFNTHSLVYEFCTWPCRSHTRLEWFSSAEDRLTCPSQSFPVGKENWKAYCFSLGFKKLWITKNYQHASFSECHFLLHCYLGNIFPRGRQQLLGNLYQADFRARQEDLSSYFSFQGSPTGRIQWFFLVEWIIVAGRTKNTFKCPSFEGKTLFTFKWAAIPSGVLKMKKWRHS